MVELARHHDEGSTSQAGVAEHEDLPRRFRKRRERLVCQSELRTVVQRNPCSDARFAR
jgi:hypothetical protein